MKAKNIYEMIENAAQEFHGRPAISYKEHRQLVTKNYEVVYEDIQRQPGGLKCITGAVKKWLLWEPWIMNGQLFI